MEGEERERGQHGEFPADWNGRSWTEKQNTSLMIESVTAVLGVISTNVSTYKSSQHANNIHPIVRGRYERREGSLVTGRYL
jgi:hypothetical protein